MVNKSPSYIIDNSNNNRVKLINMVIPKISKEKKAQKNSKAQNKKVGNVTIFIHNIIPTFPEP